MKRILCLVVGVWLLALHLTARASPIARQTSSQMPAKGDWEALFVEGEGKSYVLALCQRCHDLKAVALGRYDTRGWRSVMARMNTLGAALDSEDVGVIADYLGKEFGPKRPTLEVPLDLNTATADQLTLFPALSAAEIAKIVSARQKKRFRTVSDLRGILPARKVAGLQPFVVAR